MSNNRTFIFLGMCYSGKSTLGKIVADTVYLGSNAMIKGDLMFKTSLKTDEGAEINGYISKDKKGEQAKEDIEIENIIEKPELGKPTLVKSNNIK